MTPRPALAASIALALLLPACRVTLGGGFHQTSSSLVVDGVELEAEHVETLAIDAWDPSGLAVAAGMGDVRVERSSGGNEIVAVVHEAVAGDATVRYEEGRLLAESRSGRPCALGDVLVRLATSPASLRLTTGAGDVEVAWLEGAREVTLQSGMGDVRARGIGGAASLDVSSGAGHVDLGELGELGRARIESSMGAARVSGIERVESLVVSSGAGDVHVERVRCGSLRASAGMGGVRVVESTADQAELECGIGDVLAQGCTFGTLEASSGMGAVRCRETTHGEGSLRSGAGSVRQP